MIEDPHDDIVLAGGESILTVNDANAGAASFHDHSSARVNPGINRMRESDVTLEIDLRMRRISRPENGIATTKLNPPRLKLISRPQSPIAGISNP